MRFYAPLIALALASMPALAQTPNPASAAQPLPSASAPSASAPTNPRAQQAKRPPLKQRFDAANTTHDGHLTLEQAQAGLPHVACHFNKIDKGGKGYVTLEEIRRYYAQSFARQHRMKQAAAPSAAASTTTTQ
jgi:hypothetical protein